MKRNFGLSQLPSEDVRHGASAPTGRLLADTPVPNGRPGFSSELEGAEAEFDHVDFAPLRRGGWPQQTPNHPVAVSRGKKRDGISSADKDFAALCFSLFVLGLPGIGVTFLLVGYLLFFS